MTHLTCNPENLRDRGNLRYSDLDFKLKKDAAGNIIIVKNEDAISQSIKTILSTYPGERIMLPEFGSRLKEYLFNPMDLGTRDLMEAEIEIALERWEPRISVIGVNIQEDIDGQKYVITIEYSVIDTGTVQLFEGKVRKL